MAKLAKFAIELPICYPWTPITAVIQLCVDYQIEWGLLLDDQQHPQGLIRLIQVLALNRRQPASTVEPKIGQYPELLHAIEWTSPDRSVDDLWPVLLASPQQHWGFYDADNGYYLLKREALLSAALNSPKNASPPPLNLQALTECLTLPSSIQNRSRPIACNTAWQKTFGDGSPPLAERQSWQFHRLPLALPPFAEQLPITEPVNSVLWLVVASPDGPDAAVLNSWLTGVSHELKSPLTSLLGLSTLLIDERLGQLNPKQRHYVDLVQQTVRRLVTTINHLLDWVRLDTGQLTLNPMPVDLRSLWSAVEQQLYEQGTDTIEKSSVDTICCQVSTDIQTVFADPLRLRQILVHLIGYCLTRTRNTSRCSSTVEYWGPWVAITISDQECLPVSQQSRLFHPQGFSSGLSHLELRPALAWHLTRLHGGDISFTSSAERGSHFTVLLPVAETSSATVLLLLVADDHRLIDQVVTALEPGECRVAVARSLPEAVDKATRLQPAAILSTTSPLSGQANPVSYLQQRIKSFSSVIPLQDRANPSQDEIALKSLGYPLPQVLQQALQIDSAKQLTVLRLCANVPLTEATDSIDIADWLDQYHCRVLEVDDLLQANLLSRVWQPDVILLDPDFPDSKTCIAEISELSNLSRYPLVVLTNTAAAAAAQYPQLHWRAYLQPLPHGSALGLIQAIREAIATASA